MMRKTNGNLHFYINGLDQGVAATRVPNHMWGVVDLYGMTVKVTIVDRDECDEWMLECLILYILIIYFLLMVPVKELNKQPFVDL